MFFPFSVFAERVPALEKKTNLIGNLVCKDQIRRVNEGTSEARSPCEEAFTYLDDLLQRILLLVCSN